MYVCMYIYVYCIDMCTPYKASESPASAYDNYTVSEACVYIYLHVCMYTCMYIYVYGCTYIYVYFIDTYTWDEASESPTSTLDNQMVF